MDDEGNLRKEYKKKMDEFHSNMGQYDTEIQASVLDNSRCQADYEEVAADLRNVKEEYELMVEERRKRDEIAAILKKKNDELNAK
jgi:predicted nuclease with TOPRIM domain